MNRERMLEMCRKGQWNIDRDLDWSAEPRPMDRDEEIAVVQYFTDMSGIELLAGQLFEEQRRRTDDPTMKKIFATFVADEKRHSEVASRLADFYDVHHYRDYEMSPSLQAFFPHFVAAVRHFSAEIANMYITAGELLLDVALLRSLNDFVHDDMSQRAMDLINRDESRHIAVDYHMTEYYASPAYQEWLAEQPPRTLAEQLRAWWSFANLMYRVKDFAMDVFWEPMARVDPSGRRMKEALKRIQLLVNRPEVAARPFPRLLTVMRDVATHPVSGPVLGEFASRVVGAPRELLADVFTEEEARAARRMTMDEMAQDALAAKTLH